MNPRADFVQSCKLAQLNTHIVEHRNVPHIYCIYNYDYIYTYIQSVIDIDIYIYHQYGQVSEHW